MYPNGNAWKTRRSRSERQDLERYRSGTSLSVVAAATNESNVAHATRTSFDQTLHVSRPLIKTSSCHVRSHSGCSFGSFHLDSLVVDATLPYDPFRTQCKPASRLTTTYASHFRALTRVSSGTRARISCGSAQRMFASPARQ